MSSAIKFHTSKTDILYAFQLDYKMHLLFKAMSTEVPSVKKIVLYILFSFNLHGLCKAKYNLTLTISSCLCCNFIMVIFPSVNS